MISSSSSGVKCLKNLDIVMESADEGQALLLINTIAPACNGSSSSSSGQEREHQLQQGDDIAHAIARPTMKTKMKLANAISDDDNDEGKVTTTATLKGRKKGSNHQQQQPSRVERSRLSVITFLNNITAPPTRTDGGKSWRSLSVSSSSVQQHHHNHQQHLPMPSATTTTEQGSQMELEKQKMNTETDNGTTEKDGTASTASGHRLTKSLCGTKTADEAHHHLHIDSIDGRRSGGVEQHEHGASSGGSAEKSAANSTGNGGGTISIGMANCVVGGSGNVMLADRLSIKSGASSTSSSGAHSESQCNLSVGKQMKARECPVCYIRQQPNNFHKLQTCSHLTCKTCLVKYLNLEIMESRTNISCPNCTALLHASDIYALLDHQPDLLERYELFALRRALSTDPDARWCPAPDCTYAVIAYSCAACPQLKCERCETMFCYHCKNNWHPNQTCDQARSKLTGGLRAFAAQATAIMTDSMSTGGDVTKACPRCGVQIMKMNDGSCNHMQCVLCNAEFCWLCLKQINELHYLSPTGCTFWGKKPWTRKKKLLWQVGTLIGAPLGIALIAGLAVPGIICGVPIFVGRKIYQRFANLSKTRRRLITALGVFGSLLVSPVLAVLTVGVGVPIMLAYVYGVVPLSLCRNGGCGGGGSSSSNNDELLNGMSDFDVAYGEAEIDGPTSPTAMDEEGPGTSQNGKMMGTSAGTKYDTSNNGQPNNQQQREEEKTSNKSSFHHRRQSIASSGLVSLTDKVNTEDASIQAIAGSQYNFDSRSVHTVWSSGQYGVQLGAVELAQEANSYNNEDAENSSTLACCSASIVAQASERRSLTGSNGSIRNIRPRSSISNSRANSEEKSKFLRKVSHNCKDQQQHQSSTTIGGVSGGTDGGREDIQKQQQQHVRRSSSQSGNNSNHHHPSAVVVSSSSSIAFSRRQQGVVAGNSTSSVGVTAVHAVRTRPRLTFRSFLRHPVNSIFGSKSARVKS